MSSGPHAELLRLLAAEQKALTRPCPEHDTPAGMLCPTASGRRGVCPERLRKPQPHVDADLFAFYVGVEAANAVHRAVERAGGTVEQAERHLADLVAPRMAHEPGA